MLKEEATTRRKRERGRKDYRAESQRKTKDAKVSGKKRRTPNKKKGTD